MRLATLLARYARATTAARRHFDGPVAAAFTTSPLRDMRGAQAPNWRC